MILTKLGRQLRREILANKAKTAVLGLMTLVALYYWAPLLVSLFRSADENTALAMNPTRPTAVALPSPVQTTGVQDADLPPWRELAQWIQDDPLMHSATLPPGVSPFRAHVAQQQSQEIVESAELEEAEPFGSVEITPELLGMQLTSTLVGPTRSIVQISGRTYVVARLATSNDSATTNTTNKITFETEGGRYQFDIESVHPGRVVLRDGDRRFVLNVKRPALADNERVHFFTENN